MIIPSILIQGGQAVDASLSSRELTALGDPLPLMEKLTRVGLVSVIDVDASAGAGDNGPLMHQLLERGPCRVSAGILDEETAWEWLDAGAHSIVIGPRAKPSFLRKFPKHQILVSFEIGGAHLAQATREVRARMEDLAEFAGGFTVRWTTEDGCEDFVELDRVNELIPYCGEARLTVSGRVRRESDVATFDRLNVDVECGTLLCTQEFSLADIMAALLADGSGKDLWPTVVVDEHQHALGLAWSNLESLRKALEEGKGIYYSRSRKALWQKGENSGATQELVRAEIDCDRDSLRFLVRQHGKGFCHLGMFTCWGPLVGLGWLETELRDRAHELQAESPEEVERKLREKIYEYARTETPEDAIAEASELVSYIAISLARKGGTLTQVSREIDRRARRWRK